MKRLFLAVLWLMVGATPAFAGEAEEVVGVNGTAKVSVRPDQFIIWVVVETKNDGIQAMWDSLRKDLNRLYSTVTEHGVTRDQFQIRHLDLSRRYYGGLTSTRVQITVPVDERNGALLDTIQRGTSARIRHFGYESSEAAALQDKARALAVSNAMEQINNLAQSRGGRTGRVLSIDPEHVRSGGTANMVSGAPTEGTLEKQSVPLSTGMLHFRAEIFVEAELVFDK